eukprot:5755465-Amphidinium_carterae.1
MEVDELLKGKGKKGSKGDKAGGKKGGKRGSTTGGEGKGRGDARLARFEGYCGLCGKYGHKQKDCWQGQKGKSKGSQQQQQDGTRLHAVTE